VLLVKQVARQLPAEERAPRGLQAGPVWTQVPMSLLAYQLQEALQLPASAVPCV